MAEYIDRKKLLMEVEALPCDGCTDVDCGECIQELIDDAEPEDIQPVRHGRWIDRTEAYNDVPKYSCSQCGFVHIGLRTRFCPECGTKMDGGKP